MLTEVPEVFIIIIIIIIKSVTAVFNHLDKSCPMSLLIQYLVVLITPVNKLQKLQKHYETYELKLQCAI